MEETWELAAVSDEIDEKEVRNTLPSKKGLLKGLPKGLIVGGVSGLLSIAALVISIMSYISSNQSNRIAEKALSITEQTHEANFKVFWRTSISENKIKYEGLSGGQVPQGLIVYSPFSLTDGYWIPSANEYESNLSELAKDIDSQIQKKGNLAVESFSDGVVIYLLSPVVLLTRYTVLGEVKRDISLYQLNFKYSITPSESIEENEVTFTSMEFVSRLDESYWPEDLRKPGALMEFLNSQSEKSLLGGLKRYGVELQK